MNNKCLTFKLYYHNNESMNLEAMLKNLTLFFVLILLTAVPVFAQDAGSVSGTVTTGDGDPVEGAQIVLMGERNGNGMPDMQRTESDEEGNFTFDEVDEGNYNISAMAMRLGMAQAQIEVAAGEDTFVELVLGGGGGGGDDREFGSVSGTVSTEDGDLVEGAQVVLMGEMNGNNRPDMYRGETNADGEFNFDRVAVGNYHITATMNRQGMAQDDIEVVADENTEVDLVLGQGNGGGGGDDRPTGSVSGTVSTEDGAPVENAQVVLMGEMNDNRRPDMYRGQTNADGEFSFESVVVGNYHITAVFGREGMAEDDIEVIEDENTEVDLVLAQGDGGGGGDDRPAGSVSGTVSNEDGDPVENAQVVLMGEMNDNRRPEMYRGETNAEGEFNFERVVVGNYHITATMMRLGMAQDDIEVAADENTEVDLVLAGGNGGGGGDDREAGSVSGTVSTEEGDPVENAQVVLMGEMNGNRRPDIYRTETNAEGEFSFERVVVGNYHVTAGAARLGRAEDDIEVAADENTFLEMVLGRDDDDEPDEVGGVAGTVTDDDGEPIARAEISLMGAMDDRNRRPFQARTRSNEEGNYSFENVPAGRLLIVAGKIGYMPIRDEIEVTADEVLEYDIVLEEFEDDRARGSVSGNVSDVDENPIARANVMLMPQRGDDDRGNPGGGWDRPLVAFTDEEGNFAMDAVPVGNYTARAAKMGYGFADEDIEVNVDENTEVNFVLEEMDGNGGGGGDRGGHGDHRGEHVDLHGLVIVIDGDRADVYLLDTDEDGEADFLLNFGPPDYQPDNGAERPANGDEVDITGLRVGHMEPGMVIVLTINDQVWLDIEHDGHGGRPGGGDGWDGVNGDPDMVEAEGHSIVIDEAEWYDRFTMNTDDDHHADYRLFFGDDNYSPDNGALRPENGDFASIIGGEFIAGDGLPIIVVYEINGQLWREPGDTTGLYWDNPNAVNKNDVIVPVSAALVKVFPNPFNSAITIDYFIPEAGRVNLTIFNAAGRHIQTLSDKWQSAGEHQSVFTGLNHPAGVYILRMETGKTVQIRRLLLLN